MRMRSPKTYQSGFTLIELLVVMTILALLSVISYRAITSALDTRAAVNRYSSDLREFELGLFILAKDLQQIQRSPVPDNAVVFSLGKGIKNGQTGITDGELLSFYRSADAEMLRGVTQVGYALKADELLQWQRSPITAETFTTPIMRHIQAVSISLFDAAGKRPSPWSTTQVPSMVEIRLQHARYGEVIIREAVL